MKVPYSIDIERVFLATLIKHPEIISEYVANLNEDLCYNDIHKIIINGIINLFASKKTVDRVLLSEYLSNIGLASKDGVDIVDYIQTITTKSAVAPEKFGTYFTDIYKYHIARKIFTACQQTTNDVAQNINQHVSDLVSIAEKNLTKCITTAIEDDYKPIDVYDGIGSAIEDMSEHQFSSGINFPYQTWNRWWGPLTVGDLTVIAAPAKAGKSTILSHISDAPFLKTNKDKNIKVLILDTEMETYRFRSRKVAAISGVNEYFISRGIWRKNIEMNKKVQDALGTLEGQKNVVKHLYVANIPMDKICSIIRRWAIMDTDPDDFRLVIYDYLKLTGEKKDDSNKEWQILGDKCDTLKHLCSEVNASGLAAIQTNQQHDVAASQRIKWFASNVFLFRKKNPDELSSHGSKFGTHILSPFEMRNLGPDWLDEEWVKTAGKDGVLYQRNYLNFKVDNFNVEECGTYKEFVEAGETGLEIDEDANVEELL